MKIAVLNCPSGITAEALLQAFQDAGLNRTFLKKELLKRHPDKKTKALTVKMLRTLGRAGIYVTREKTLLALAQAALALRYFGIERCFVRNIAIGRKGNPRTLKLLQGFVLERKPVDEELVTPDGAVLLNCLCEKEISIPATRLERVGFGPKGIQVSIGETVAPFRRERILLLETNIDDMSPQGFELLYERLFKAGALDVWVQPILMKKMRLAFKLSVLLNHKDQDEISEVIFKETTTLGARFLELDRFSLARKTVRLRTRFGSVRFKIVSPSPFTLSPNGGEGSLPASQAGVREYPEYEDVKRIAIRHRLPFRVVQKEMRKGRAR